MQAKPEYDRSSCCCQGLMGGHLEIPGDPASQHARAQPLNTRAREIMLTAALPQNCNIAARLAYLRCIKI